MKKNPFSLFDFLGYVFPGAFALLIVYLISECQGVSSFWKEIQDIPFKWEDTILLTLLSYILGHFLAYVSSLTVEKFSIWLYGYPV